MWQNAHNAKQQVSFAVLTVMEQGWENALLAAEQEKKRVRNVTAKVVISQNVLSALIA